MFEFLHFHPKVKLPSEQMSCSRKKEKKKKWLHVVCVCSCSVRLQDGSAFASSSSLSADVCVKELSVDLLEKESFFPHEAFKAAEAVV